jgi:hypothetical protein
MRVVPPDCKSYAPARVYGGRLAWFCKMEYGSTRQRFRRSPTTQPWRTTATTQTRNGRTACAPKPYIMDRPSDAHSSGDSRPGGSSTCTVNHWSAQRHSCGGDTRPGGACLQHAKRGHTPSGTATTQGTRDSDARPGGPCTRSTTAYVHRSGPTTLSVTHCSRDNRPDRDHLQAQCFTGQPSDTPAVETPGQAEHACNMPSSGTRPEARQQPKTYATRMHAPEAPASAAPQPTSTGPAQRRSVSLTAAETTGPAEDDLCPAQLGYTPCGPCTHSARILSAGLPSNTYYSGDNRPSRQ